MFKHSLFMFLDLQVSGDQTKIKAKEKFTTERWTQILDRTDRLGPRIRQRLLTISCFWYFFATFF